MKLTPGKLEGLKRVSNPRGVIAAAAMASPALAEKPYWAGAGHSDRPDRNGYKQERGNRERARPGFDEARRERVHAYYAREMKRGHCPPGLRQKHNGCMPPGQARNWRRGEPLPRVVADYIAGMTDRFALDEYRKLFDPDERG